MVVPAAFLEIRRRSECRIRRRIGQTAAIFRRCSSRRRRRPRYGLVRLVHATGNKNIELPLGTPLIAIRFNGDFGKPGVSDSLCDIDPGPLDSYRDIAIARISTQRGAKRREGLQIAFYVCLVPQAVPSTMTWRQRWRKLHAPIANRQVHAPAPIEPTAGMPARACE